MMKKGFERQPPKEPGTRIGNLTILEPLEHGDRGMVKKQWWYKVQCDCGTVEEANHAQLVKKWACKECMGDKKGMNISLAKRKPVVPEGIPDFAKMKLRGF